jgi:hypothetical protein
VRVVYVAAAVVPIAFGVAIAACATEGDALVRIARDSGFTSDAPDTIVIPDAGPDTRVIRCGNGDACVVASGEQCCADILAYICTEVGACKGGPIPCDQPGHCATGERCCGSPTAFLISTQCQAGACAQYEMCARDADCPAPKTCKAAAGNYGVCE